MSYLGLVRVYTLKTYIRCAKRDTSNGVFVVRTSIHNENVTFI
jgi:hypothetical protein